MKHKSFLLLLAIAFTVTAYAGDSTGVKKYNRVYVGLSFTPGINYRLLSHNYYEENTIDEPAIQKRIIDRRNKLEKPGFNFDLGAKAGVRLTRFLSLETGLNYSRRTYVQKITDLNFYTDFNPSLQDTVDNGYYVKLTDVYHYIDIPLGMNFYLGKTKWHGIINTGINFNVLLAKQITTNSNIPSASKGTRPDRYPFNTFNLSPFLGVGFEYEINSLMSLRVMPVAQMQALKNIDTPITEHLWSAGINTCLLFGFKKVDLK